MNVVKAIFGDPGLKLLAIVAALGVWVFARQDLQVEKPFWMDVEVRVENPADGGARLVDPEEPRVKLTLKGPADALRDFGDQDKPVIVRITDVLLPDPSRDNEFVAFDATDLEIPALEEGRGVAVKEMLPAAVRVEVWRRETRTLPLSKPELRAVGGLENVEAHVTDWPKEAVVSGRTSALRTLLSIRTFIDRDQIETLAQGMGNTPEETRAVPLRIHEDDVGKFELEQPARLEATVRLRKEKTVELDVPIELYYSADSERRLQFSKDNENKAFWKKGDPPKVTLTFAGVPSALAALQQNAGKLRAFVLESDLAGPFGELDVRVDVSALPEGVWLDRSRSYRVLVE